MSNGSSFFAGLFLGVITGSVLGILAAPTSGKELRVRARTQMQNLRADMESAMQQRQDELEAELEQLLHSSPRAE